jgi:hypothetical protein
VVGGDDLITVATLGTIMCCVSVTDELLHAIDVLQCVPVVTVCNTVLHNHDSTCVSHGSKTRRRRCCLCHVMLQIRYCIVCYSIVVARLLDAAACERVGLAGIACVVGLVGLVGLIKLPRGMGVGH